MTTRWRLRFLGTGAAHAHDLGNASGVIERDGEPWLMIDCGPDALIRFHARYGKLPRALYITHTHMDHVGGLEELFYRAWFGHPDDRPVRLYAHADLVPLLQRRVADYPSALAEGGTNFWDVFTLVPCTRGFWHGNTWFEVFATRHHKPGTSFGLALPGSLVWTGDTRPVPEALSVHAARGELVAHDCGLVANPSHTGVDDLAREYDDALRERLVLYHYGSVADGEQLARRGLRVARPADVLDLAPPLPPDERAG